MYPASTQSSPAYVNDFKEILFRGGRATALFHHGQSMNLIRTQRADCKGAVSWGGGVGDLCVLQPLAGHAGLNAALI